MLDMRLAAISLGVLVVLLSIAGCGGGSGGQTSTASIGRAAFVKKANAVCTNGEEKMHSDFVAFSNEKNDNPNPSKAEYEEFVNRVIVPDLSRQIAEIRALGAPAGDESRIDGVLAAIEEGLRTAKEKPESVTTHTSEIFANAIKRATSYGLAACAQSL